MQIAGLILIAVGCLVAALFAVIDPDAINLSLFLPALGGGALGVALVQIARRRENRSEDRIEANFEALDGALKRVVKNLTELESDKEDVHVYDLPDRIDHLFADDLGTFADARESIRTVWGAQGYSDVMTPFAAGERYLNRVWSTAIDGWVDEAHTYLERSRDQFAEALKQLEALHDQGRAPTASAD